jgi:hypothetical protein
MSFSRGYVTIEDVLRHRFFSIGVMFPKNNHVAARDKVASGGRVVVEGEL